MDSFISSSWSFCTQCNKSFPARKFVMHVKTVHNQNVETSPNIANKKESSAASKAGINIENIKTGGMDDISNKVKQMYVGNPEDECMTAFDNDATLDELLDSDGEEENENIDNDHKKVLSDMKPEAIVEENIPKKRKIGPASKTGRVKVKVFDMESFDGEDKNSNTNDKNDTDSEGSDSDDDIPQHMPQSSDDDSEISDNYDLPFKLPLNYDDLDSDGDYDLPFKLPLNDDDDLDSDEERPFAQTKTIFTPVSKIREDSSEESDSEDENETPIEDYKNRRPGPASKTGRFRKKAEYLELKKATSPLFSGKIKTGPLSKTAATTDQAHQVVQKEPIGECNDSGDRDLKENNTTVESLNEISAEAYSEDTQDSFKELGNGNRIDTIPMEVDGISLHGKELEDGQMSSKDPENGYKGNGISRNSDDSDNDSWGNSDDERDEDDSDDEIWRDIADDESLKNQSEAFDNPGFKNVTEGDNQLTNGDGTKNLCNFQAENDILTKLPENDPINTKIDSKEDKGKDDENNSKEMTQIKAGKELDTIQNENANVESETTKDSFDNKINESNDQVERNLNDNKSKLKFRIPKNDIVIQKPTLPTKSSRIVRKENQIKPNPWRFWQNGQLIDNSNQMIYQAGQIFNDQIQYPSQDQIFNTQIPYLGQDQMFNSQISYIDSDQFFNNQIPHVSQVNEMFDNSNQSLGPSRQITIGLGDQILDDPRSFQSEQIFDQSLNYSIAHQYPTDGIPIQPRLTESDLTLNQTSLLDKPGLEFNEKSSEDVPSKLTEKRTGPKTNKTKSTKSTPNVATKRSEPNKWTLPEDQDESSIKLSNDMADACRTQCKVCSEVIRLVNMRNHTKGKHKMPITEYKSQFGTEYEIIEKVYHKCGICSTIVLLDSDSVAVHLKTSVHKAKDPNGTSHKQYNEQYMVMAHKPKSTK